jgi:hypothetical protein
MQWTAMNKGRREKEERGERMVSEPILKAMQHIRIPRPIISSNIKDMQLHAVTLLLPAVWDKGVAEGGRRE